MSSSTLQKWLALIVSVVALSSHGSANSDSPDASGLANACPVLVKVVVAPLSASIGEDIDVFAAATDEDGGTLTYAWAGTGGSFADSAAQSTKYTCEEEGNQSITVTVTDPQSCTATRTAQVTCAAPPSP